MVFLLKNFALTAAIFEGCLVPTAVLMGWILDSPPLRTFRLEVLDALWGIVAALPPLLVLWLCLVCSWRPIAEIAQILNQTLLPLFRRCRLAELAMIAALAGLGEEMLFRGVVQAAIMDRIAGPRGTWIGLLAAAVLFGLLHPLTLLYAFLAGSIGLYLGWLWLASGNLLVPIIAHALYDFLALWYLVRHWDGGPK